MLETQISFLNQMETSDQGLHCYCNTLHYKPGGVGGQVLK